MQWLRPRYGYGRNATRTFLPPRRYVSDNASPEWFTKLRDELLNRDLGTSVARLGKKKNDALELSLKPFMPCSFYVPSKAAGQHDTALFSLGTHLLHFDDAPPTDQLLPDGTDNRHSPGEPWVRRMWAGGSMRVNMLGYYNPFHGWIQRQPIFAHEWVKDVELRGRDDTEKLFVTIERRFERVPRHVYKYGEYKKLHEKARAADPASCSMVEERTLVFLKERSAEEKKAIEMGELAPVKYAKGTFHGSLVHLKLTVFSSNRSRFLADPHADTGPPLPLFGPHVQCARHTSRLKICPRGRRTPQSVGAWPAISDHDVGSC